MLELSEKIDKLKKHNEESRTRVIQLEQQEKIAKEELEEIREELNELGIKEEDLDSTIETLQKELETTVTELNKQAGIS